MGGLVNPKISIIIPIYNAEKYLERCLDSIINQTLKEIEIICINDGSTDNSLLILEKYAQKDKRIIIENQNNEGVSSARNKGLKLAKGEYVGYVDADDEITKDFYELLYTNAKKHNAEISCGEIRRPDSKRKKHIRNLVYLRKQTATKTEEKYKLARIPERCFVWNKIYKREPLLKSKIEFPVGVTYEDILWSHQVLHQLRKLVVIPKAIYNFYWNLDVIRNRGNNVRLNNFAEVLSQSVEYAFANNIRIKNYKFYKPLKRIRVNILGIRFFDIRIWDSIKVFYILGIEICRVLVNNNKL